jgi:hypothetical protein
MLFVCVLLFALPFAVSAQDGPIIVTPIIVTPGGPAVVTPDPALATALPVPTSTPVPAIINDALPVLISARSDLELLASSQMNAERPLGWTGSLDISDPQLAVQIRLDLELLAGQTVGLDTRPIGWFGAVGGTPYTVARDIRHDLEVLADSLVSPGVRPPGWAGSDPLLRCGRATQTLVRLIERSGYLIQADPNSPNFCAQAELEASGYVEANLLVPTQPPPPPVAGSVVSNPTGLTGTVRANLRGVAVFRDRNARQRIGVLPRGISFAAIARSTAPFSNMMLVRGEGFEVFVDYTFTTLGLAEFESLPDVATVSSLVPQCTADWCD